MTLRQFVPLLLAMNLVALADSPPKQRDDGFISTQFLQEGTPRARLLLLGTFHFEDAGLDGYKPKHPIDILSPERQKEVADVLARLAAFKPTKIAIEADADWQAKADERLPKFLAGQYSLEKRPNEIFQLGFRLAQVTGLRKLYCIDIKGREFSELPDSMEQFRAIARGAGEEARLDDGWDPRFNALYEFDDELKTRIPLRNFLLYINSPERLRMGHGAYLTGMFKIGAGGKYTGADVLAGYWYDRNLRIFSNILKLADSPAERVVVIFGAGHLPILRHLAQSSPEIELVEVRAVLGAP